ncbi:phytoene desaturase family protein [Haloferula sargassicola]|uniref:4,4'-diapolycopene oxygenase n=1 Tax=Haloferula sargassicola TaxID=490096 RepID=A0ABP9UXM9_9BACT
MPDPAPHIAVIGAGLGGLAAAISLRARGASVEVFEKNDHLGGKLNVREIDGFTFDLGPSIFTLPQIFRELFERAGRDMDDYLTLQRVTPQWRNFFENHLVLDLHEDPDRMRAELAKLPGDPAVHATELEAFLDYARGQYEAVEEGYFAAGLDTTWEMIRHYGLLGLHRGMDWTRRMDTAIAAHFHDESLRRVFEYFIKYVGSSAKDAPAFMNLMPIIQFDYGLWYVKGGMFELSNALGRLARELGVRIHTGTGVREICREGKKVTGVVLDDGSRVAADQVVSNMEVIPAHRELLGSSESQMKRLRRYQPACSGLVLHLGTDRVYPQLAHHNFFYSKDQSKHFDTVFRKGKLPDDPTIYLVAPTRTDPSKAPDGCDNIKILPHIPPVDPDQPLTPDDYLAFRDRVLDKLERMGLEGLRRHTIVEDMLTPPDLETMYRSNRGSIYGVVSDWRLNRGFKAPKKAKGYDNLWFVGGSANPGGGMPMVVLGGMKACDRLCAQLRMGS